jgi:hypothetical protein
MPPMPPTPPVANAPGVDVPVPSRPTVAKGRAFVIAGVLAVAVVAGLFIFFPPGRTKRTTPPSGEAPPVPAPAKDEEAAPAKPTVLPIIVPAATQPDTRHVQITVQPAGASLFLDNKVAGGNLIKMDVARSQSSHVVQAKAPGHVPFKKTISFANDVYLDIKLEKVEVPAPGVRAKVRSSQVAAQLPNADTRPDPKPDAKADAKFETKADPKADSRFDPKFDPKSDPKFDNRVAPAAPPVEDFGMNLQRPTTRRPTKKIDETDPYSP